MELELNLISAISFRDSWKNFQSQIEEEVNSLKRATEESIKDIIFLEETDEEALNYQSLQFENQILNHGWSITEKINGEVYYTKSNLILRNPFSWETIFHWVFKEAQISLQKYYPNHLPIALTLVELSRSLDIYDELEIENFFETSEQLFTISPLLANHPFLILGLGENHLPFSVSRIRSLTRLKKPLINKSIEFPPELYEAGRGILTYFGTYLNDQYGDQKAKVTIQQDDEKKILRMTVESETGDKEVIEKAYEEYRLIVSKQTPPEQFTSDEKLILKLHNRIDILELEVKQEMRLRMVAEGHSDKYFKALDKSLGQKSDTTVHVHQETTNQTEATAEATATAMAEAHQNLSLAIGSVNELKDLVPAGSTEAQELEQLEQGLQAIKKEQDSEVVGTSPAMVKFKRILEKIRSKEGKLAKAVEAAENGYEVFKDVATTYNKIADWCGLPHVPRVLLDK